MSRVGRSPIFAKQKRFAPLTLPIGSKSLPGTIKVRQVLIMAILAIQLLDHIFRNASVALKIGPRLNDRGFLWVNIAPPQFQPC